MAKNDKNLEAGRGFRANIFTTDNQCIQPLTQTTGKADEAISKNQKSNNGEETTLDNTQQTELFPR